MDRMDRINTVSLAEKKRAQEDTSGYTREMCARQMRPLGIVGDTWANLGATIRSDKEDDISHRNKKKELKLQKT